MMDFLEWATRVVVCIGIVAVAYSIGYTHGRKETEECNDG